MASSRFLKEISIVILMSLVCSYLLSIYSLVTPEKFGLKIKKNID